MIRLVGPNAHGQSLLEASKARATGSATPVCSSGPLSRRTIGSLLTGVLGGLLAAVVPGPSAAQQVPAVGIAAEVQGEVLVTSHGDMAPKSLAEGDPLFEGDHVETGRGSRARLVLEDGSLVQVGGSSALDLEWVLYAPALDSRNVILTADGVVRFVVEAVVPRSSFEVKTQTAISTVDGADWIVATKPEGTWVVALEGEVTVANIRPDVIGQALLVGSDRTLVPPGGPPGEVEPLSDERREAYLRRTALR